MSFWKKLFGGSSEAAQSQQPHQDFVRTDRGTFPVDEEVEKAVDEIHAKPNPESEMMNLRNVAKIAGKSEFMDKVKRRYEEKYGKFATPVAALDPSSEWKGTTSRAVGIFDPVPDKSLRVFVFEHKKTRDVGAILAHTPDEAASKLARGDWYDKPHPRS